MDLKTITESRWRWWILLIAAILLVATLCCAGQWLETRRVKTDVPALPQQEIAAMDNVTEKLKNVIENAQSERNKLPEVIKSAKDSAVNNIVNLDDAAVADRWNGLLGRYRESRAAAEGVLADQ